MGPRRPAIAACLGLAACSFDAGPGGGRFRCEPGDRCPDGSSCVDGWCEQFDAAVQSAVTCQAGGNVRLTFDDGRSAHSGIAWAEGNFGLIWTQATAPLSIRFDLVDAGGAPRRSPITLSDPTTASSWPTIAWTGSVYGAFWAGQQAGGDPVSLLYRSLSADGTPSDGDPVPLAPSESGAVPTRAQVPGGGEQGVAWQNRFDGNDEVYFNRFTDRGESAGDDKLITDNLGASWFPSLAWSGTEWGVAWNDDRDGNVEIYFTRLDRDGERVEGDRRISNAPGASFAPALIWTGDSYLLSWWDGRADPSEIFVSRVVPDATSEIGPEVRITPGEYGTVGLLARSQDQIGLVWHGFRDDLFAPLFALLDPATGELATEPVPVSDGGVDIDPESLAMTATDDGFAVVWSDDRSGDIEIYFASVTCR